MSLQKAFAQIRHGCFISQKAKSYRRKQKQMRWISSVVEILEDRTLLDGIGPRLIDYSPTEVRNDTFDHIDVVFNEAIDAATFGIEDVSIAGSTGTITIESIQQLAPESFRIHFSPITTRGSYQAVIGPNIADLAGNLMDQDQDGIGGEATQDQYVASLLYIDADAIFVSSITIGEGDLTYEGQDLLIDGTTVTINGPHSFSSVHLINGGVLTHSANTTTQTHKLDLTVAEQVIVDASSRIDVSGKGYLPGRTSGNTTVGGATGGAAGAHGGTGGIAVYGDYADPDDWGAGGNHPGGGLVRLVAGTLALDGSITAHGLGLISGSGAGGGIYVAVTTLHGSGNIRADGGAPSGGNGGSGGGGGRIAVYAQDLTNFPINNITALGGVGHGGHPSGGAGTVHIVQGRGPTRVKNLIPAGINGGYISQAIGEFFTLQFSRAIDITSFDPSLILIEGQMGRVQATSMTHVGDTTYRINLATALNENGTYRFTLLPTLLDSEGFPLDQNANGIPGELTPSDLFLVVHTTETLAETDIYSFTLTVDPVPPRIVTHTPGGDLAGTVSSVDVFFSEAIDKTTFTASDIVITRPGGQTVAVSSIQEVGFNRFRINFPAQTLVGQYHVRIGPDVRDLAGNMLDQDQDGNQGETGDDVYNATFNLVEVDLGLENLVVGAAELVAGELVTVSWSGRNVSGAPLLGSWIDAVYLSRDNQWDIGDIKLSEVLHTGGLAENAAYNVSTTVLIPGTLPGNYHILVRADIANQSRETDETNNLIASDPLPLTVLSLPTDGAPVNGSLSSADRLNYYAITLGSRETFTVRFNTPTSGARVELYLSYAAIPTRMNFDERSSIPGTTQEITLTAIQGGGTYYIMVYGDLVPGTVNYSITAEKAPFFLTAITPTRHGNALPAVVSLTGAGFNHLTVVDLVDAAGNVFRVDAEFISGTTLRLSGLPNRLGHYTVRVTKDDATVSLLNAFEVTEGGTAKLETNLIVPSAIAPGFPTKRVVWVEYRNIGTVAMAAPLLQVSVNGNGLLTTSEELANAIMNTRTRPVGLGNSVQVLGIGSSATPGLLQPGESARIPVYYVGMTRDDGSNQIVFTLGSLTTMDTTEKVAYLSGPDERVAFERPGHGRTDLEEETVEPYFVVRQGTGSGVLVSTTPGTGGSGSNSLISSPPNVFEEYLRIDWREVLAARPDSIPEDAWGAIVYNLRHDYGDLWANYVGEMAGTADYLAGIGQRTSDVSALWGLKVADASAALNPVRYLAGAVDASAPAPGLPLTFSRVYGQDIVSRFRSGVLGRGWTHNWDVFATASDTGDVVLHGPGGVERFFVRNVNGTYTGSAGDYGRLTVSGGAFALTETDGTVWQFRTDGKLDHVRETNGNRITLGYEGEYLTSLTHSNGRQFLLSYDTPTDGSPRRIVALTDTAGPGTADDRVTTFAYDTAREHLVRVTAPGNRITEYAYQAPATTGFVITVMSPILGVGENAGNSNLPPHYNEILGGLSTPDSHALLSVTHPDGTHDLFDYDDRGRLISTSRDGGAEAVTFTYAPTTTNEPGRVLVTDASNRETTLFFGLGGQLAQVRDGDGRIVNFGYDGRFQFASLTGPGGERYRYSYDASGNLTGIRDALNLETSFSYEPSHQRLASFTDARGNGIDYEYDTRGNLTAIVYADNTEEVFTYDTLGNVTSSTNRRGDVIAYTYNPLGQVLTKDYVATPGIDFIYTYDTHGNLTSAADFAGVTTMIYDAATDRLTRIEYPDGHWFEFTYDAAGRRETRTDETGRVVNYHYDQLGRLDTMTVDGEGLLVDYDYDAAGRLSKKTLGNGVYTTYEYDAVGNITNLVNLRADGVVLSRYGYTYDLSGRRTSMTTLDGTFSYGYDALGQLIRVEHPDGRIVVYDYDEAGNRIRVIDNGVETAYTTNALNQYTQVGGITYEFDADGNLISQTEGGVTTTFTYDIENRLVGVDGTDGVWEYRYDALGNRVGTTANGVATTYVIDPTGLGNVAAEYDGAGALVARYDHGYGLLSRKDGVGATFYTFQVIGHTSELTGTDGVVLNTYQYDPFGVSMGKTETVANPFEYVGEYGVMNEDNGLEFMRARYYQSEMGRFVQTDPIGILGGLNLFNYTSNSPIMAIDPSGLFRIGVPRGGYVEHIPGKGVRIQKWVEPEYNNVEGGGPNRPDSPPFYDDDIKKPGNGSEPANTPEPGGPAPVPAPPPAPPSPRPTPTPTPSPKFPPGPSPVPAPHPTPPPTPPPGPSPTPSPVPVIRSRDPNDKLAPAGHGDAAFIQPDGSLAYTVRFENQPDATAPAREVIVTDVLDPNLDLDTFELTEITFANFTIAVPPGRSHYEGVVPMVANGEAIQIEVNVTLDKATRTLTLTLLAVDPTTGWVPEDPFTGLLYPEDGTGRGQGSVSYLVRPLTGLPTGTVIENRAKIFFDFNDPIDTPLVFNTLDVSGPSSQITTPSGMLTDDTLTLTWAGEDDLQGSGIATYEVFASVDGGAWFAIVFGTTNTSQTFTVVPGRTYAFYSVATDNVGHRELPPLVPDTFITILSPASPLEIVAGPDQMAVEGSLVALPEASITFSGDLNSLTATINWGDGNSESATFLAIDGGAMLTNTHTYADDGLYIVTITISDGTVSVVDRLQITVANVAPTTSLSGAGSADEGSTYILTIGSVIDPGDDAVSQYIIHWGDGQQQTINAADLPLNREITHIYADGPDSHTIRIDLIDEDGIYTNVDSLTVGINNIPPTVELNGAASVDEGSVYTLTIGSVVDPGNDTVTQYIINWGDGTPNTIITAADLAAANGQVAHVFADGPNAWAISVDLVDEDGIHVSAGLLEVTINDVAPTIALLGAAMIDEGSIYTLTLGDITDPGNDTVTGFVVHWGDGFSDSYSTAGEVTHVYADGPLMPTITVDLIDEEGLHISAGQHTLTVKNVPPSVTNPESSASNPGVTAVGQVVTVSASFSDPGFDTLYSLEDFTTSTIDWGDGVVETVPLISVTEIPGSAGSLTTGTISGTHAYAVGGIYTITITVRDDDGGATSVTAVAYVTGVGLHRGVLQIVGTNGRDQVQLIAVRDRIEVQASFAKDVRFSVPAKDVDSILIVLADGDDHVNIHPGIDKPATIDAGAGNDNIHAGSGDTTVYGGAGNDRIFGGIGNDLLFGGPGDDLIQGRDGNDILVGGDGFDILHGGRGDDILIGGEGSDHLLGGLDNDLLIGGFTAFDNDEVALRAIRAEWTNPAHDYNTRISHLSGDDDSLLFADRLNKEYFLKTEGPDATVFDDEELDLVFGTLGDDWSLFD